MRDLPSLAGAAAAALLGAMLALAAVPALAQNQPEAQKGEAKGDTVRPEVGKPLQAAQELIRTKQYKEALAKVHEAEAVPNRTAFENYMIDRMRGSAAAGAGDDATAIAAFEASINSGRLPPAEQLKFIQVVASLYYRQKDYAKTASWGARYIKEGGTDAQMQELLIQAHYLGNDFAAAARGLRDEIEADEKAGRTPPEDRLQFLASCYLKMNDAAGYSSVLEKLVADYPKKQYWADVISRLLRKPGFSERLELDLLRLEFASGNLTSAGDYMALTQLALQAGYPAEAKKVIDQGFAAGVLGKGNDAERHKRLLDLATRQAADDQKTLGQGDTEAAGAKTGDALLNTGYNYVVNGKFDKGLAMMEQGLHKGGLKRPEDAKLHLGIAYAMAGQKARAVQIFHSVQGNDGTGDLARLWAIYAGHGLG
jgi:hypothetical protein